MLFDDVPKENQNDLFNRETEIKQFTEFLDYKRPLILITGNRRVGKTSLLQSILNQNTRYNVVIKLGNLVSKRYLTKEDLVILIQTSLREFFAKNKEIESALKDPAKAVNGVGFGVSGIELEHRPDKDLDLRGLFGKINEWAEKTDQTVVLAIDEAQELRKSKHLDTSGLLASIYDNCEEIIIVLTSSEPGLLYDFIGKDNPKSALHGKSYDEIKLEPFSVQKSEEFLRKGFAEYELEIEQDILAHESIHVAAQNLGGVLGWLNKFGTKCVQRKLIVLEFLSEVVGEGAKVAKADFEDFLFTRDASDRYVKIIELLAVKPATWNTIKTKLEIETRKKIYNKNISDLLTTLVKSGFITKIGDEYALVDPFLKIAFTKHS
jgi:hypothetical protein